METSQSPLISSATAPCRSSCDHINNDRGNKFAMCPPLTTVICPTAWGLAVQEDNNLPLAHAKLTWRPPLLRASWVSWGEASPGRVLEPPNNYPAYAENVLSISSPSFSLPSTSYTADTVRNQTIVLKSYERCISLPGRFRFTPHCVGQAGGCSLPRVSLKPASPAWISRSSKTPGMLQEGIRFEKKLPMPDPL